MNTKTKRQSCPLCRGRGKRMVWFGRKLELVPCCDCGGKGQRQIRPHNKRQPLYGLIPK